MRDEFKQFDLVLIEREKKLIRDFKDKRKRYEKKRMGDVNYYEDNQIKIKNKYQMDNLLSI